MSTIDAIFYILILVMSVVIHEISHGFMAEYFGDKTARLAGRLTLNPIKHLDPMGSILIPAILILTHSPFMIGWAKPVPYNPQNLSNRKWGTIAVASAGVMANFFLAIFFGLILRFSLGSNMPEGFFTIISSIVIVNIALGIFNLVPIPPLDGSKILFNLLPASFYSKIELIERYSLVLVLIFVMFFSSSLYPIMNFLFHLITGLSL